MRDRGIVQGTHHRVVGHHVVGQHRPTVCGIHHVHTRVGAHVLVEVVELAKLRSHGVVKAVVLPGTGHGRSAGPEVGIEVILRSERRRMIPRLKARLSLPALPRVLEVLLRVALRTKIVNIGMVKVNGQDRSSSPPESTCCTGSYRSCLHSAAPELA